MSLFRDRRQAGQRLAKALQDFEIPDDAIVLGLARGGVPVAYEVAKALELPFDAFIVRKLGAPGQPELAIGAIASAETRILNDHIIRVLGISQDALDAVTENERRELRRREKLYRKDRPSPDLTGRVVLIVDDGLATGATMRVAIEAIRQKNPAQIIAACPVAPQKTCQELSQLADHMLCLATPDPFFGVGAWYDDFSPTTDNEVRALLAH